MPEHLDYDRLAHMREAAARYKYFDAYAWTVGVIRAIATDTVRSGVTAQDLVDEIIAVLDAHDAYVDEELRSAEQARARRVEERASCA